MNIFTSLLVSLGLVGASVLPAVTVNNTNPNLIANPSLTTAQQGSTTMPAGWLPNAWGGTTATHTYRTNDGRTDKRSAYITVTKYTGGDAKWMFDSVNVKPSTTYTFSNYSKSNVQTKLIAQYISTTGVTSYADLKTVPAGTSWKQTTFKITTPADAKQLSVFHVIERVGYLQIDDYSLTEDTSAVAPSIKFTSPANGAKVSGMATIKTDASGGTSTINTVDFTLNGQPAAIDPTAPYEMEWDTTKAANGNHTITATVKTTDGKSATSTLTVTVDNTNPTTPLPTNNLVPNATLEQADGVNPANWFANSWGANTPVFTYPVAGDSSARAVRAEMKSYTDGDAKWYFEPQAVKPNTTYTFKDMYRSNTATELVIAQLDANGAVTYSGFVNVPASSTWNRADYSFTTSATTQKLTVFHVIHSVGWLELDNVQLTAAPIENSLLPNKSLETAASATLPLNWNSNSWGNNNPVFEYLNEGRTGNRSVKITMSNYVDGDAKWIPTPLTNLERGKQYRFTTWYKTNTLPQAVAMFVKDDGTTKFLGLPAPQPNGTANWQQYSDAFSVPVDAKEVAVFMFINSNGYLQTDDYDITSYKPVGFNRPLVTLTFDDGQEDNETTALPRMESYGFKSTQCYATTFIEGNAKNSNAVLNFYKRGHEVCSHSVTHPQMTKLTPAQLTYELTHSKAVLEKLIGAPVNNFATPFGDYNASVNAEIMKYYKSHRGVEEGYNSKDNFNPYRLRVQNMFSNTTIEEYNSWLAQAKADNTWLILVYHRVANNPGTYDTYVTDFDRQMAALRASGVSVKTYQEALTEVRSQL